MRGIEDLSEQPTKRDTKLLLETNRKLLLHENLLFHRSFATMTVLILLNQPHSDSNNESNYEPEHHPADENPDDADDVPEPDPEPEANEDARNLHPPPAAQGPMSLKAYCIVMCMFFTLAVSSCFLVLPLVVETTVNIRDAFPSGNQTSCGWQDHLRSFHVMYPMVGLEMFADSDFSPQCDIQEPSEPATVLESAVEAVNQFFGVFSRGLTQLVSDSAVEHETGITPIDENGGIKGSDVLYSFAEFWVQADVNKMAVPWPEATLDDIVQYPFRWLRVSALRMLQFYISKSAHDRDQLHTVGWAVFLVLVAVSMFGMFCALDPDFHTIMRIFTLCLLHLLFSDHTFWDMLVTADHLGVHIVGGTLLLAFSLWLGTPLVQSPAVCRAGIHLFSMAFLFRALFLSAVLKEAFPSVHLAYCLCALTIFCRLAKTFVDDMKTVYRELGVFLWTTFPRSRPEFVDYYAVLGVAPTVVVLRGEINRAYKRLALKYHPDKNRATDAAAKFRRLTEAKELLLDGERKALYDWKYGFVFHPQRPYARVPPISLFRFIIDKTVNIPI